MIVPTFPPRILNIKYIPINKCHPISVMDIHTQRNEKRRLKKLSFIENIKIESYGLVLNCILTSFKKLSFKKYRKL